MKDKSYDYQKTLTAQVIAEFDANRTDVVLAAACGAGKTFMAISLCEELLQKYPSLRTGTQKNRERTPAGRFGGILAKSESLSVY